MYQLKLEITENARFFVEIVELLKDDAKPILKIEDFVEQKPKEKEAVLWILALIDKISGRNLEAINITAFPLHSDEEDTEILYVQAYFKNGNESLEYIAELRIREVEKTIELKKAETFLTHKRDWVRKYSKKSNWFKP